MIGFGESSTFQYLSQMFIEIGGGGGSVLNYIQISEGEVLYLGLQIPLEALQTLFDQTVPDIKH